MPLNAGLKSIVPTLITTTGAGSTSTSATNIITVTNLSSVVFEGLFSSTYNNYLMVIRAGMTTVTNGSLLYRMKNTGSASVSNSTYTSQITIASGTDSVTTSRDSVQTYGILTRFSGSSASNPNTFTTCYIFAPYLAQYTLTRAVVLDTDTTLTIAQRDYATSHGAATSYDSMEIFVSTGAFSGTFSIYGFTQ